MTRYDMRQQKCTLSRFWRPEVQNQGVGRVSSFQNSGHKGVLPASPSSLVAPGVLGLWPQHSSLCLRPHMDSLCGHPDP